MSPGSLPPDRIEALWTMAIAVIIIATVIAAVRRDHRQAPARLLLSGVMVIAFVSVAMLVLGPSTPWRGQATGPFPWFALTGLSVIAWPLALRWLARMPGREAFLIGVSLAPITVVLQVLLMLAFGSWS